MTEIKLKRRTEAEKDLHFSQKIVVLQNEVKELKLIIKNLEEKMTDTEYDTGELPVVRASDKCDKCKHSFELNVHFLDEKLEEIIMKRGMMSISQMRGRLNYFRFQCLSWAKSHPPVLRGASTREWLENEDHADWVVEI